MSSCISSRDSVSNDPVTQNDFPDIWVVSIPSCQRGLGGICSGTWISSSPYNLSTTSLFSAIYVTKLRAVSGQISLTSRRSSSVIEKSESSVLFSCHCEERSVLRSTAKDKSNPFAVVFEAWIASYFAMTEARARAVFFPTFAIPSPTSIRSSVVCRDFSSESIRFCTDFSLYHSRVSI